MAQSGENFFDFRARLIRRPRSATREGAGTSPSEPATSGGDASRAAGPPVESPLGRDVFTVARLTEVIDAAIQRGLPSTVYVRGELSNVNRHRASGHIYFTLKDSASCIDCVMWRSDAARLKFDVADGQDVLVTGSVKVYADRGRYQLYARKIEPLGKGALEAAFRQLHAKLEAEGLFAVARKRAIPSHPLAVALVTSRQGAALQDMLKVLRRYPFLRLAVFAVPVQGEGAATGIAEALRLLNREVKSGRRTFDVVLLARGGGSLEDLWSFNEEAVARAVAACAVPVITGIGHEVDTSIADLVADHHAHTPTEAAQVVVSRWRTTGQELQIVSARLVRAARSLLTECRQRLNVVERHELFRRPTDRINRLRQRLDDRQQSLQLAMGRLFRQQRRSLEEHERRLQRHHPAALVAGWRARLVRLDRALLLGQQLVVRRRFERLARLEARLSEHHPQHMLRLERERIAQLSRRLEALSPESVLKRGYSITRHARSGKVVRSVHDVKAGDKLLTRVADGELPSVVRDSQQPDLFGD